ncbi:MAG: hypothetical protein CMD65_00620 [Gammaproteobacteria bacterium]|nr:hypothetical protein [Gammaproteobacteria bacterium]|tara:strand:- start:1518 stop:1733 length:216 start_codon:yes stop_codon:yes gene_type:complete
MVIIALFGIVLFLAVGGFAYNFGGCIAGFLKLNTYKQYIQVLFLVAYVYLVYANQEVVINAYMTPINNLIS